MADGRLSAFEHFARHQGGKLLSARTTELSVLLAKKSPASSPSSTGTPEEFLMDAWSTLPAEQKSIYEYCASLDLQYSNAELGDGSLRRPYVEQEEELVVTREPLPREESTDQPHSLLCKDINANHKCEGLSDILNPKSAHQSQADSPKTAAVGTFDLSGGFPLQSAAPPDLHRTAAGPQELHRRPLAFRPSGRQLSEYWNAVETQDEVQPNAQKKGAVAEVSTPASARRGHKRQVPAGSTLPAVEIPSLDDAESAYDFFVVAYCLAGKHPGPNNMIVSAAWEGLGELERHKYEIQRDEALARRELQENGQVSTVRKRRRTRLVNETSLPINGNNNKKQKSVDQLNNEKKRIVPTPSPRCDPSAAAYSARNDASSPLNYSFRWDDGEEHGNEISYQPDPVRPYDQYKITHHDDRTKQTQDKAGVKQSKTARTDDKAMDLDSEITPSVDRLDGETASATDKANLTGVKNEQRANVRIQTRNSPRALLTPAVNEHARVSPRLRRDSPVKRKWRSSAKTLSPENNKKKSLLRAVTTKTTNKDPMRRESTSATKLANGSSGNNESSGRGQSWSPTSELIETAQHRPERKDLSEQPSSCVAAGLPEKIDNASPVLHAAASVASDADSPIKRCESATGMHNTAGTSANPVALELQLMLLQILAEQSAALEMPV